MLANVVGVAGLLLAIAAASDPQAKQHGPNRRLLMTFDPNQGCDTGWIGFQQHCYKRFSGGDKAYYDAAKSACAAHGAYIATPNIEQENSFLADRMNPEAESYTWIGFDASQGTWEDGSGTDETSDWRTLSDTEQYDLRSSQPVIFMRASGAWSFDPKDYDMSFVCEKNAGTRLPHMIVHYVRAC